MPPGLRVASNDKAPRRLGRRTWIVSPILGAALIALAISSVQASEVTRRGDAVSSHVGARGAVATQAVSPAAISRHVIATPGRFARHRGFAQSRRSTPFGSFDDFGDFGSPGAASEAPPGVDSIEPPPAPSKSEAKLPTRREMTPVGVVIERHHLLARRSSKLGARNQSHPSAPPRGWVRGTASRSTGHVYGARSTKASP
jgi:hypothetical protein